MSMLLRDTVQELIGPALFLATVVNVKDPQNRNRVQVRLYNADGIADQDGPAWARVAVPFAGGNRGAELGLEHPCHPLTPLMHRLSTTSSSTARTYTT